MIDDIFAVIFIGGGLLMMISRKREARRYVEWQYKLFRIKIDKRWERFAEYSALIAGPIFIIFGILSLLGVI